MASNDSNAESSNEDDQDAIINYPTFVAGIGYAYEKEDDPVGSVEDPQTEVYGTERASAAAIELGQVSSWWHLTVHGLESSPPEDRSPPVSEWRRAIVALLNVLMHKGYDPGPAVEDIDIVIEMLADQSVDDVMDWCSSKASKDADLGSRCNVESVGDINDG